MSQRLADASREREESPSTFFMMKQRDSISLRIFKDKMRASYSLLPKKTLRLLYGDLHFGDEKAGVPFDNNMSLDVVHEAKVGKISPIKILKDMPEWKSILGSKNRLDSSLEQVIGQQDNNSHSKLFSNRGSNDTTKKDTAQASSNIMLATC